MKLSKEAKEGLEWAVKEITIDIDSGLDPEKVLKDYGIKTMENTLCFLEYLRETKRTKLLNKITKWKNKK